MCDKILLIFEQNCNDTDMGDSLFVTGNRNELGDWKENNDNKLETNQEIFPLWKSKPISIPYQDKLSFEYKYFIKKKNNEYKWEDFNGNRKIEIHELKCCTYIIKDEKFNDNSEKAEIKIQMNEDEKENLSSNNEDKQSNDNEKKNNNLNNNQKKKKKEIANKSDKRKEDKKDNKAKEKKLISDKIIDAKKKTNEYEKENKKKPISENIDDTKEKTNEYEKENEENKKKPISENFDDTKEKTNKYEKNLVECKIGLENIGATCYMNSTLQCFCHIKEFINYFKVNSEKLSDESTLAYSFKLLIDELWPDDPKNAKKFYSPHNMKEKISKMNPLFEGIAACDAKDLVNFIIMKLHEELNKVKNHPKNNNNIFLDQTNEQLVFNIFMQDFANNNQSIISDLFYGTNKNITQCSFCNYTVYNYQIFFFLNFPLEEVRKFKNQQNNNFNNNNMYNNYNNNFNNNNYNMCFNNNFMNNNCINNNFISNNFMNNNAMNNNFMNNNVMNNNFMNNNCINTNFMNNNCINTNCIINSLNEVNILDCFDYDKKFNFMTGENKMFCNYCKINQDCLMKTELVIGPEILIILLNRGKGLEFDVKIKFTKNLDLNNYFDIKDPGCKYELIGVITHIGENNMGGHFIAYCKDHISNKWLLFNDAIVDYVKDFEKQVINFSNPYLLFYRRIKNNN